MRIGLVCSDNLKTVLVELLTARNISIDDQAGTFIVESGFEIPPGKIAIVFEITNMTGIIELLDRLSRLGEDIISTIVGRNNENYEVIPFKKIFFFEGRGKTVFCITANGEYRVKEKLYELEERLPQNRFVRVNKSFIVNISNIKEIIPWFGRRLVLKFNTGNMEIEVSKNYVKGFKEFLGM